MESLDRTIEARIYGDSIMKGTVMDPSCRYHARADELLKGLMAKFNIRFENRARFGSTVEKGLAAVRRDLESKPLECEYAVVEFGGNDCNFKWNEVADDPEREHLPFTTRDAFVDLYTEAVISLQKRNIKTVLMTLPPIDAEKYLSFIAKSGSDPNRILKWLGDTQMIYRFHESYSNLVVKIAKATRSYIVDVRSYFLDKHNYRELICDDGLHPTEAGYGLIIKAFEDFVTGLRAGNIATV